MTKTKSTKRALISSALALVMCVAMLIGTTFAWFTDSVTSGRNTIQSGNLDVELYYAATAEDAKAGNWTEVDADTNIFGENLWEPGYTKVAYFKVENAGSLALKYQLTADVYSETAGVNAAGESFLLSDYIYTGIVDLDATRDSILASTTGVQLKDSIALDSAGTLEAGKSKVLGLAIWMPTSVDNEANHNGTDIPSIEFGINLFATQYTFEKDSFDDQYDADAKNPTIVRDADAFKTAVKNGEDIMLSTDITVGESVNIAAGTTIYGNGRALKNVQIHAGEDVTFKNVVFDGVVNTDGSQIYSNGSVTVDGCTFKNTGYDAVQFTPVAGSAIVITNCVFGEGNAYRSIHIQPKSDIAADENNGITLVLKNNYIDISRRNDAKNCYENQICIVGVFKDNYTAENNTIVYSGKTISNVVAWVGVNAGTESGNNNWDYWNDDVINSLLDVNYLTPATDADSLANALEAGEDVVLIDDVTLSKNVTMAPGATLNGNGKTITGTDSGVYLLNTTAGTIKNVTVAGSGRAVVFNTTNGEVIIDNCVLTAKNYAINGTISQNNFTIKNSTLASWVSWGDGDGNGAAFIDNCIFGSGKPDMMGTDPLYSAERLQPQTDTTVSNSEFKTGFAISPGKAGITITLNNCTFNGVAITAENFVDIFNSDPYLTTHTATFVVNGVTVALAN